MASPREYVFGYASLAASGPVARRREGDGGFVAHLRGMRRGWGVAMDNRVDLPGYKCYVRPDGRRPDLSVCFLDIETAESSEDRVNGVCLPVDATRLAALDRRERNYDRIDVSDRIEGADGMRVWTYRGSTAGRARFRAAVDAGTAVIHAGYLEMVKAGFQALGAAEWAACAPSLQPGALAVVELVRRELA